MPRATLRRRLIGASLSWFLFDVYSYGLSVYSAVIVGWIYDGHISIAKDAWINVLSAAAGLPGVFLSVRFLERTNGDLGRLQAAGFATAAAAFCAFAALWGFAPTATLFMGYVGLRAAINFGASVSTFVAPALLFPTPLRASCNGLASAIGKLGGLIGTFALVPIVDLSTPALVFFLLAFVAAAGLATTLLLLGDTFNTHYNENFLLLKRHFTLEDDGIAAGDGLLDNNNNNHKHQPPDELSRLLATDHDEEVPAASLIM